MIYLYDMMHQMPVETLQALYAHMPLERRERAARYQRAVDWQLCVLAYGLLCYGLHTEYGITEPPTFAYGPHGKPFLRAHPTIFFNISHTQNGVACAVSDRAVGVDIQAIRPYNSHVAKRVCSDREWAELAISPNPAALFCRLWAVKEAYIKRQGGCVAHLLTCIDAEAVLAESGEHTVYCGRSGYYMACLGASEIHTVTQITQALF